MPEHPEANQQEGYPNHQSDPEWKAIMQLVGSAGFGLFALYWLCSPLSKDVFWPVFIGASVNWFILLAMFFQAHITKRQWKAMEEQAAIALRQLERTDRPWLAVDVVLTDSLTFNDRGGALLRTKIIATNVGRSVAVNAIIDAKVVIPRPDQGMLARIEAEHKQVCQGIIHYGSVSHPVFPGHTYAYEIGYSLTQQELEQGRFEGLNSIELYLVGCVDYQFSGHDTHHQTRFIYQLLRTALENPYIRLSIVIGVDAPLERLIWEKPWIIQGDYAD